MFMVSKWAYAQIHSVFIVFILEQSKVTETLLLSRCLLSIILFKGKLISVKRFSSNKKYNYT
jgi:hypothetical protein